jgi:hypothetical protein
VGRNNVAGWRETSFLRAASVENPQLVAILAKLVKKLANHGEQGAR